MNVQSHVLGIDVGTTAVRIVAISEAGAVRAEVSIKLEFWPEDQPPNRQSPLAWWQSTRAALHAIRQRVDLKTVQALSVDATSGTILGVDKQGAPVTVGRMYNDKAEPTTVEALGKILPENCAARGTTSPLARMIEMQRPGIALFLHQADWLSGQFSGLFDISDENNALKSGFDLTANAWPAWMSQTALDQRLLPRVVPTGTDLGPIRSDLAMECGMNPDCRIVSGTTDGCASFIGSGACDFGDAVTSLGTTLTLKQICRQPVAVAKYGIYSHRLGNKWLCGGASNSGGAALLRFFSQDQLTALESSLNPDADTNLNYYPLPASGERFPDADPSRESMVAPRPDDDVRFLQGLLEGIASIEKKGFARLREFGAPALKRVFTVGGGSHNEPWRRIRERKLGVPVTRGIGDAAYGSARIALAAVQGKPLLAPHGNAVQ